MNNKKMMKASFTQIVTTLLAVAWSADAFVPTTHQRSDSHRIHKAQVVVSMASSPEMTRQEASGVFGRFLTTAAAAAAAAAAVSLGVPSAASAVGGDPFVEVDDDDSPPYAPAKISKSSSQRAMALSNEMKSLNPKLYGAFWCPHCTDQKNTMGKEAFATVQYIECSKDGVHAQVKLCKNKKLPGYPTWEIGGRLFPGEKDLDELEEIIKELKTSGINEGPKSRAGFFGNWLKKIDSI